MKILFISNHMPPIVDGVGDYTYNLAHEFAYHGHEVTIISSNCPEIKTNVEGITILPIITKWNKKAGKQVATLVKEHNIDIVSLQYVPHGYHPKGLPFGLIPMMHTIKKTKVKIMIFFHEVCIDYRGWNIKHILCSWGIKYIAKKLIKNSDYVATSIEHYVKRIQKLHKNINVPAIRIASNIPFHTYNTEHLKHLKNKIAPNGEFIVLFFGKRDINYQVEAIQELISQEYKIIVLSVGNTLFLSQNYKIPMYKTGLLDINDISQYFQIADCFCLPENEKSGATFKSGSLAAGLQYGLPIITNSGFMTEKTLQNNINILFVKANDKDAFKKKLLILMKDKTFAKIISDNAKTIGKTLTWENTYQHYMDLINNYPK